MSKTQIPPKIQNLLWGKSAGRCEFEGCNKVLYRDSDLTQKTEVIGQHGHIVSDSPDGPRGNSIESPLLAKKLSNLMLLCPDHHKIVDSKDHVKDYQRLRLEKMKADHELRIETLTAMQEERRSHVILYGANVGNHATPLNLNSAALAMSPNHYPADNRAIELSLKNSGIQDKTPQYWATEEAHLSGQFERKVAPLKGCDEVQHFSLFTFAPMPLLIKLGTLLSDIYQVDLYERQREPEQTWAWAEESEVKTFKFIEPTNIMGVPVLLLSISGTITHDRITDVLGKNCSIWTVTIDKPKLDIVKTRKLLMKFRKLMREVFDRIKAVHGQNSELHVFPAMAITLAIETGRVWMPKSDLPLIIYDQNSATPNKGFTKTITIQHH
jgi:SMODS-associated and fused to various effectors sensor domain